MGDDSYSRGTTDDEASPDDETIPSYLPKLHELCGLEVCDASPTLLRFFDNILYSLCIQWKWLTYAEIMDTWPSL